LYAFDVLVDCVGEKRLLFRAKYKKILLQPKHIINPSVDNKKIEEGLI